MTFMNRYIRRSEFRTLKFCHAVAVISPESFSIVNPQERNLVPQLGFKHAVDKKMRTTTDGSLLFYVLCM